MSARPRSRPHSLPPPPAPTRLATARKRMAQPLARRISSRPTHLNLSAVGINMRKAPVAIAKALHHPDMEPRLYPWDLWPGEMSDAPSLREIGRGTGIHYSTLSLIFSRKRIPGLATARKLAAFFGVTMDRLFEFLEVDFALYNPKGKHPPKNEAEQKQRVREKAKILGKLGISLQPVAQAPSKEDLEQD